MSEKQDQTSEPFGNLGNLLGSLNSNQDSQPDDFNRLQEMLVDPELLKMRDRVVNLETKIQDALTKIDDFVTPSLVKRGSWISTSVCVLEHP